MSGTNERRTRRPSDSSDNSSSRPSNSDSSRQQRQTPPSPQMSKNAQKRAKRRANKRDEIQAANANANMPNVTGPVNQKAAGPTNIADTTGLVFDIMTPVGLARHLRHHIVSNICLKSSGPLLRQYCPTAITLWWLVRDDCLFAHQYIRYMGNLYTCRCVCGCVDDSPDWRSGDLPHPWVCL